MGEIEKLIYADDAVKAVTNIYLGTAGYRARVRLWDAVEAVKHIPTVNAVPVVHGEWSVIEDDWEDEVCYECSICKKEFATLDETPVENLWNYCPNCGAKMDGDENG